METLYQYQVNLLRTITNDFVRYLHSQIEWNDRFVAIKGLRGVGKTTLLLQYLKFELKDTTKNLYVTLDHPYFYDNSLYDLAVAFDKSGGKVLLVDEVHKLKNWSKQLKIIYDGFPDLQVIFSSSSALDLYRGEADLSRRVITHQLSGLSFREYLKFTQNIDIEAFTVNDILENHLEITESVVSKVRPLPHFKAYLKTGYFPFAKGLTVASLTTRLTTILEVVLTEDMAYVQGYSSDDFFKLKKLLAVVSETVPFTVNVTSIANDLNIGRNKLKEYLHAIEGSGIIRFLNRDGKGISTLKKPDKIYLENTNLSFALKAIPNDGTLRETFALNQLSGAGFDVKLPSKGDMLIEAAEKAVTFEIGGKNKTAKQLEGVENSFVLADDIEVGFGNKIPLYLMGFLY